MSKKISDYEARDLLEVVAKEIQSALGRTKSANIITCLYSAQDNLRPIEDFFNDRIKEAETEED